MRLNFLRGDSQEDSKVRVGVVIISGSCCIPSMKSLDEQAQRIVEQAISETGVVAQVKIMPATTAFFGGAPKDVMAKLMTDFQSGKMGVPAILINGRAVSYGMPRLEDIKAALLQAADADTTKEEKTNE